ncbi:hypothetical protein sscle_07g056080 [Sclerotinia sclerotiorum 1980 UF-70]|uniref:Uncharacterized protein n=1 Tax=Sclerotinia sclerotiorum (strain ATCC 18683 / 1980 / Ss-1) TaxID=665079 RepID=A0A1D9Q7B5_SCLS1|nr:hypothetical protein sscle_07g056080 [Sclerotinia sclerotiorum 1980 UF-70]
MSVASVCKLGTCPLEYGMVHYQPTLFGSVFYLVIFAALLIIYVIQLRHWNAWSFSYCMLSGLALELVGYLGRIQMHCDPFAPNPFLASGDSTMLILIRLIFRVAELAWASSRSLPIKRSLS